MVKKVTADFTFLKKKLKFLVRKINDPQNPSHKQCPNDIKFFNILVFLKQIRASYKIQTVWRNPSFM